MDALMYFLDENGQKHDSAKVGGYSIAERTLEDVMMTISFDTIKNDWVVAFNPKDSTYLQDYNTAKFLSEARDYFDDLMTEGGLDELLVPGQLMIVDIVDANTDIVPSLSIISW